MTQGFCLTPYTFKKLEQTRLSFLEKAMATHSSTFAWKIPWTEEPGGLQSMGSQRVGHDWATSLSLFPFMHWRRKWQPTRVLAWRIPGMEEPGGLPSVGSHRVGHDWSDLAAAAGFLSITQMHLHSNKRGGITMPDTAKGMPSIMLCTYSWESWSVKQDWRQSPSHVVLCIQPSPLKEEILEQLQPQPLPSVKMSCLGWSNLHLNTPHLSQPSAWPRTQTTPRWSPGSTTYCVIVGQAIWPLEFLY